MSKGATRSIRHDVWEEFPNRADGKLSPQSLHVRTRSPQGGEVHEMDVVLSVRSIGVERTDGTLSPYQLGCDEAFFSIALEGCAIDTRAQHDKPVGFVAVKSKQKSSSKGIKPEISATQHGVPGISLSLGNLNEDNSQSDQIQFAGEMGTFQVESVASPNDVEWRMHRTQRSDASRWLRGHFETTLAWTGAGDPAGLARMWTQSIGLKVALPAGMQRATALLSAAWHWERVRQHLAWEGALGVPFVIAPRDTEVDTGLSERS